MKTLKNAKVIAELKPNEDYRFFRDMLIVVSPDHPPHVYQDGKWSELTCDPDAPPVIVDR